jgi:hypothetical protein
VRQKQQSDRHTLARQKEKITEQSVSKLRKICTIFKLDALTCKFNEYLGYSQAFFLFDVNSLLNVNME